MECIKFAEWKKGEEDQYSLYEVEAMIDDTEADMDSDSQRNLLIAYDQIIKFIEEREKYLWSGNLEYRG